MATARKTGPAARRRRANRRLPPASRRASHHLQQVLADRATGIALARRAFPRVIRRQLIRPREHFFVTAVLGDQHGELVLARPTAPTLGFPAKPRVAETGARRRAAHVASIEAREQARQ